MSKKRSAKSTKVTKKNTRKEAVMLPQNKFVLVVALILMLVLFIFGSDLTAVGFGWLAVIGWILVIGALLLAIIANRSGDTVTGPISGLWCKIVASDYDEYDEDDEDIEYDEEEEEEEAPKPKPAPEKRICQKCGKEVPEGNKCCGECGTKYEPKPKPAPAKK